jgi:hypothetical protein
LASPSSVLVKIPGAGRRERLLLVALAVGFEDAADDTLGGEVKFAALLGRLVLLPRLRLERRLGNSSEVARLVLMTRGSVGFRVASGVAARRLREEDFGDEEGPAGAKGTFVVAPADGVGTLILSFLGAGPGFDNGSGVSATGGKAALVAGVASRLRFFDDSATGGAGLVSVEDSISCLQVKGGRVSSVPDIIKGSIHQLAYSRSICAAA